MNPYEILELKNNCTTNDIKTAYRNLSKKHHPDINNGESTKFMQLNLAYKVLSDPNKRKLYDEQGVILDERPDHVETLVRERLMLIATHWLDNMLKGNNMPLQEFVMNSLNNGIKHIDKNIKDMNSTMYALQNISKRLKHKSGDSVIHKIINQRIKTINKGKIQNKTELVVIDKVMKIILDYEYKEEELFSNIAFGSSATSTTTTFGVF